MKITKEQIRQIESDGCRYVKEWFPKAFKTELEVGRWYKHLKGGFVFIQEKRLNNMITSYGFYRDMEYYEFNIWNLNDLKNGILILADKQEVFEALKNEAISRGFTEGSYWKDPVNFSEDKIRLSKGHLKMFGNKLDSMCFSETSSLIFFKGVWAEIIQTITTQEAEKLLNKKIV